MSGSTKLSARALRALEILKAGGAFRYGLESGWHGEKFMWSLAFRKGGAKIAGYGGATYRELERAGYEFTREASGFTGSAAYYSLKAE